MTERAKAHDDLYLAAYRTHLTFYERQYEFWHNPAVMNVKIGGNNIHYWGVQRAAVLPPQARPTSTSWRACGRTSSGSGRSRRQLEAMYREWNALESREWRRAMVSTAAFPAMFERHTDMVGRASTTRR